MTSSALAAIERLHRRAPIPILALALAACVAAPAAGQEPRLLGVPAEEMAPAEESGPVAGEATPADRSIAPAAAHGSLGRSGSLRVVLAHPGEPLAALGHATGEAWERGHRWVPQYAEGPRVLGEATEYMAPPLEAGEVRAPDAPGVWRLESADGEALEVITLVPASDKRNGRLNGYHIGSYPATSPAGPYAPPAGFVEVTPANQDVQLSEHLRLGQFLTKDQFDVWPKYVALDMRLIDKLELVMQELRVMGVRAERLHVMSGYRTPQYNGPGGNGRAALSRHMYGDAADVWIDNNGDGRMDDLNGDGRVDIDDAALILRAVERVERRHPALVGGAGTYPENAFRGPYIHIDVRGERSRW